MRVERFALVALMAAVLVAGVRWGTFTVGGSDSSCYVLQARGWATWQLQRPQPLVLEAPWPEALSTFAVSGHVASATVPGAMVPICASGLSIIMAAFLRLGGAQAVFLVVPCFGALLVGALYMLGARIAPRVGLAAAGLTATSPVFIFQLVQPMSDVPAAALWCTALALALSATPGAVLLSGFATSMAIMVRPNLLPLGLAIGAAFLVEPGVPTRVRLKRAAAYAAGSVPGCLAVACIQQYFYGSPFSSGYGSAEALFAFNRVGVNLQHYLTWLHDTETPVWLLALAAPALCRRWLVGVCASLIMVNLACYLPYVVFDDWWYLRFLLPTLPLVLLLSVITLDWMFVRSAQAAGNWTRRHSTVVARLGLTIVTVVLMAIMLRTASDRSAFALAFLESRFRRAGDFVATRLAENAVVLTSWESGSVTYYSGRQTVVWDALDPGWLDRALDFLRSQGLQPVVLVERWEEAVFRQRFAGSLAATLDWPPSAEIGGQVRIYRPEDRARYHAGELVRTDYAK